MARKEGCFFRLKTLLTFWSRNSQSAGVVVRQSLNPSRRLSGDGMQDFGMISTRIWSDPGFSQLSDGAESLLFYLLACPHGNSVGIFHLPPGYLLADRHLSDVQAQPLFNELHAHGFARRCEETHWVWLVRHLEKKMSDKQRIYGVKQVSYIPPSCCWLSDFCEKNPDLVGPTVKKVLQTLSLASGDLKSSVKNLTERLKTK